MPHFERPSFAALSCLGVSIAVLATVSSACMRTKRSAADRTCSEAQALTSTQLTGAGMDAKTLSFTFDDGPGPRTLELSRYLRDEGIQAAFFVNGKMLTGGTQILADLVADGHVIANHTQTHADLTSLGASAVVSEVDQTDALIAPFVPDNRFMFRPPFGAFNDTTISALESSSMSKYAGPILWDIGDQMGPQQAADWACWGTNGETPISVQQCGDLYLTEIRQKSNGIVLMHDPYFIGNDPAAGGTVDMVKYMVPILKSEGFKFQRVDMVPMVASVLPPLTTPPPSASSSGSQASSSGTSSQNGDSTDPCAGSPQGEASE